MEGAGEHRMEQDKKQVEKIQHRCICCGQVRESSRICSCPNCGYKMYPEPYVRRQVLQREIKSFFEKLEMQEIPEKELVFTNKDRDEKRFPHFEKIYTYVCSAETSERYFERLERSITELHAHLSTPFQRTYQANFEAFKKRILKQDEVLKKALKAIGVGDVQQLTASFSEPVFPEMKLLYREVPDEALVSLGDSLLKGMKNLADKSRLFLKKNNIYGTPYQAMGDIKLTLPRELDAEKSAALIKKGIQRVEQLMEKRYVLDLFSDGSEELSEMLVCLWRSMKLLLELPVLVQEENYQFMQMTKLSTKEMKRELSAFLQPRYEAVEIVLREGDFFSQKSEDELFLLYHEMIQLDCFGYMGLDPQRLLPIGKSEQQLNGLIGLSAIKESIKKIKAYALANQGSQSLNLHMCFYGNPGTGKTEVARLIAGILYENKILPKNKLVEVDRGGLVGQYVGETPQKTMEAIREAMGGVLFIDEAYALVQEHEIYGREAVATLLKAMEDYRGKFCVILAGYRQPLKQMLESNPGFQSRIAFGLDFPNYSREELKGITELMLSKRSYCISDIALERLLDVMEVKRKEANFANAREVRNALEQIIMCQNMRVEDKEDRELALIDVNRYLQDSGISLPTESSGKMTGRILSGDEELERLVGLASIKRMMKKIRAYGKRNARAEDFNLHMCFLGNPGTGKTEVARILSRILYEIGVLPEAKLVETDAAGLIGSYVGETAPKTQAKIQEAMGGVLFIDEAYALTQGSRNGKMDGYGEEAIAALIKGMEDYRGKFCVILAGYQDEMREMLSRNPGFVSRIQFTLEFPDYTEDEVSELVHFFLEKKGYDITEEAMKGVVDLIEGLRSQPDFANARTIRNILEQVILNQNLRTEDETNEVTIILEDVEEYAQEMKPLYRGVSHRRIGF